MIKQSTSEVKLRFRYICRSLYHPIWRPKFGPILNAKKYVFSPIPDKKSQFDKKKLFLGGGGGGFSISFSYDINTDD